MKKLMVLLSLLFIFDMGYSQFRPLNKKRHSVNKVLKQIIEYPEFKTAGFAFLAIDLNSGEIVAEVNPDMALKPASTLKLLTTATALELLGPDFQYETVLEYSGTIDTANRILDGNLYVTGGGDPTLGSKYFDTVAVFLSDWKHAIEELEIDTIKGSIIADARAYSWDIVPPSWSWLNMGNYYGAGPSGISVYDNFYTLYFKTDELVGSLADIERMSPYIPGLYFDNKVTADSITWDNSYIFGAPYSNDRSIRGELPLGESGFKVKGSMPDPAYVAALHLDSVISVSTFTCGQPSTIRKKQMRGQCNESYRTLFYKTFSPPLYEIIAQTNIHSINLFAEHCLISAGIKLGAEPLTMVAIDSVASFWERKGMDIQGLAMNDGSGLSQYNAITPRQMVTMLSYMKKRSIYFDDFYNSMAIAGKTGTVKNMFVGTVAEGKLRAKSGTVSRVKAYAGYVTSESGREIAFSMVVNNFSCRSSEARAKLEQLMIALAELNK